MLHGLMWFIIVRLRRGLHMTGLPEVRAAPALERK
jgi:hypothetical protein